MTDKKPSKAAVRAARRIISEWQHSDLDAIAQIIDDQSGLPELVSALEHLLYRYRYFADDDRGNKDAAITQCEGALAMFKG